MLHGTGVFIEEVAVAVNRPETGEGLAGGVAEIICLAVDGLPFSDGNAGFGGEVVELAVQLQPALVKHVAGTVVVPVVAFLHPTAAFCLFGGTILGEVFGGFVFGRNVHSGIFCGGVFYGGIFYGGVFRGSVFCGGIFLRSILGGGILCRSIFCGDVFRGSIIGCLGGTVRLREYLHRGGQGHGRICGSRRGQRGDRGHERCHYTQDGNAA